MQIKLSKKKKNMKMNWLQIHLMFQAHINQNIEKRTCQLCNQTTEILNMKLMIMKEMWLSLLKTEYQTNLLWSLWKSILEIQRKQFILMNSLKSFIQNTKSCFKVFSILILTLSNMKSYEKFHWMRKRFHSIHSIFGRNKSDLNKQ